MLRYRHYEGKFATFLMTAMHTNGERLVIYVFEDDGDILAIDYDEFFGYTDSGVIRFELVDG